MIPHITGQLTTKKGEFIFECFLDFNEHLNADVYGFNLWKDGDDPKDRNNFSFVLRVMENGTDLKVVDLYANKYSGLGIAKAMILKGKELFGKRIISSSNKKKSFRTEGNLQEAIEKIWKPLVKDRLANYDEANDYYYLL